jgi:hypothetical protein
MLPLSRVTAITPSHVSVHIHQQPCFVAAFASEALSRLALVTFVALIHFNLVLWFCFQKPANGMSMNDTPLNHWC